MERTGCILSTVPFITLDKWLDNVLKVKDNIIRFELLTRNSHVSWKCLSAVSSLRGKTYSCWGDSSPGSAAGSTLNLRRALHRSLGNTLQCLDPLKVSCWKGLSGVSALRACGSSTPLEVRGQLGLAVKENKVFYSVRLKVRFKTKVQKQNQIWVIVLVSLLNR